jgi:hypothetical protein
MRVCGLVAIVAALVAVAGVAAPRVIAADCDNSAYWNVLSRYVSPSTGQSCNAQGPTSGETETSTFGGGYSTIRGFCSTSGGTWTQSVLLQYNVGFRFFSCAPYVGVYNNHPDTIYVNAEHHES